ncbi:MAG: peroxiredoxin [Proteobacteria bacterium]|nr:peroxiredoxin [Pseudomonadota bacterium]
MRSLMKLPDNLPVPVDDGSCDHLQGANIPSIEMQTTQGRFVNLKDITQVSTVIFFYPRTGEPNKPVPPDWDLIPGARGCTPQSCGFRDLYQEFKSMGFQIFGASTQETSYQQEFISRSHIPFEILSDKDYQLTEALHLPTFTYGGIRLLKRMAWILKNGKIVKVFYPIFPPNTCAETVLNWILKNDPPRPRF